MHDTAAEAGEGVEGRQVPGLPVAPPAGRCRSTVHSRCTPPWGGNDMGSVRRTVLPNRTRPSTITADVQPTSHFRIADLQCELAWSPSCVATAWRAVPDGLGPRTPSRFVFHTMWSIPLSEARSHPISLRVKLSRITKNRQSLRTAGACRPETRFVSRGLRTRVPHLPKNIICEADRRPCGRACQPLRARTRARR